MTLGTPPGDGLRRGAALRRGVPVAIGAGAGLVALVGTLLVVNYRSASTVRQNLLAGHAQHAQLHAASVEHLLDKALTQVDNLAEAREVAAFFENAALGMSMEYGLALSLVPIRERLVAATSGSRRGEGPVLTRVALLDAGGRTLADSDPHAAPWREALRADDPGTVALTPDRRQVVVTRAHRFKGRVAGHFVAWLRAEAVLGALSSREPGDKVLPGLVDRRGRIWRPRGVEGLPPELFDVPDDGRLVERRAATPGAKPERWLVVRVPIANQMISVVDACPAARLLGALSPRSLAVNQGVAAVAVLAMVVLAVSLYTRSAVLKAHLDESRRREQEVAEKHAALEREAAERQRLQAAHALLARAVGQAAEAILVTDTRGRVEYANPAFERMTGFRADEIQGQAVPLLAPGLGPVERSMAEALGEGRPWSGEVRASRRDGTPLVMEVEVSPVRGASGATMDFVAVARDVTEEKKLREQLRHSQKMEAIGALAGGVAHDFNNLLTAINGYAGLAMEQLPEESPVREDLLEIRRAGDRAAQLTRQLLAFGRRQVLKPQVLEPGAAIAGVERMLRRLIGEDIELVTVPGERLGQVRVDPGQLEQVLVNLVVNARDAMPQGGTLTIRTSAVTLGEAEARRYPEGAAGDWVCIAVADTGVGMEPGTLARIFEPFFTTKERGKGTGLGLSTVYGIVRQSKGFLGVESALGRGTTFRIFLPREEGAAAAPAAPPPAQESARSARPGETVLVVEDERQVRALLQAQLEAEGYAVLSAGDGAAALEVAERHRGRIHLLLSDVVMPHMSGPELAERLRASRPDSRVVFMSGYAEEAVARHGELGRADAFVQKPYALPELASTLRRLLDGGPLPA